MTFDIYHWPGCCKRKVIASFLVVALGIAVDPESKAAAQVTSDGTLPTTVTSTDNLNFVIEAGDRAGSHLFHSFESFSVPTHGSVHFDNAGEVTDIFSRVTGDRPSAIDGLIRANGHANLFLLNPNGISFGEAAELNVGGAFFATTGDRFVFDEGAIFSATTIQDSALLGINIPIGIQFGSTAALIENRSQATDPASGLAVGLQVPSNQSLIFLGGPIEFDHGRVTTEGGHVHLGAVAPGSFVSLDRSQSSWMLGYEQATAFQDILFTGTNSFGTNDYDEDFLFTNVNTSGSPGGNIALQGRQIRLNGAGLIADTWETESGNNQITIQSSDRVILEGSLDDTDSVIKVSSFETGRGGSIVIESPSLVIRSTSGIYTEAADAGRGGNVSVETEELRVEEYSYLGTETYGMGHAGNLTIVASDMLVDQSYVSSETYGSGQAGEVTINAQELVATNRAEVFNEAIEGDGDAGPTQITVDRLLIQNGAEIGSGTSDGGDAGPVTIQAAESIQIQGTGEFNDPLLNGELALIGSAIFSIADQGEGNGGNIRIETPWLQLSDGGTIGANSFSQGNGGNISIRAERIDISESGISDPRFQDRFGITSTVERSSSGNGGNIEIVTDQLNISRGGSIASNSLGEGNAGNISIQAKAIDLQGRLEEVPLVGGATLNQPLPSQIASFSEGDFAAGSVNIQANRIEVGDRANISVSNLGQGDSGTLTIQADTLRLDNQSHLQADVNGGEQGNINLAIRDLLSLYNNSSITANATEQSMGGNINITARLIIAPAAGNSDISANAEANFGGNTSITTDGLFGIKIRSQPTLLSDITASSELGVGFKGAVDIDSPETELSPPTVALPMTLMDVSQLVLARCSLDAGEFVLAGRGGLPSNPLDILAAPRVWGDLRSFEPNGREMADFASIELSETERPIKEATGMMLSAHGDPQLVVSRGSPTAISHLACEG